MTEMPILLTFTTPENISATPAAMLWLIPLTASIAVVYKATKVRRIELVPFFREAAVLFVSILVFIVIAAIVLCMIAWLFNEKIGYWLASTL
jgi:hypothetical protein